MTDIAGIVFGQQIRSSYIFRDLIIPPYGGEAIGIAVGFLSF